MEERPSTLSRSTCFSWLSNRSQEEQKRSRSISISSFDASRHSLQFHVEAETMWGQRLAVCGSIPELGDWDPGHSFLLSDVEYPMWKGALTVGSETISFSYLVVYQDPEGGPHRLIRWEQGERRDLTLTRSASIHHRLDDPRWGTVEPAIHYVSLASKQVGVELPAALKPQNPLLLGNITSRTKEKKHVSFSPKLIASLAAEEATPETRRHRKKLVTFSRCVESPSDDEFLKKYEESFRVLGTGGMCGTVYMATRRSDLLEVAVKILLTTGMTSTQERHAMSEVRNHLSMSHPNICRLLEVFEEPGRLRFVMERLRGPDLYDHWIKKGSFGERETVNYTRQISSAVAYCHSVGVCHRDLKLENVCLEDDSCDAGVKLIDFGLSVDVTQVPTLVGAVGTLYYMAPEVWQSQYDEMCDMWSLGILTYIMIDGGPPFEHEDDDVIKRLICTGEYVFHDNPWKHISGKAIHFVASLLRVEASKRLTAQAAANHIWLALHDKAADDVALHDKVRQVWEMGHEIGDKNCLENYCYAIMKRIEQNGDEEIQAIDKAIIEKEVQETLEWIDKNHLADDYQFEAKQRLLEGIINPIVMKEDTFQLAEEDGSQFEIQQAAEPDGPVPDGPATPTIRIAESMDLEAVSLQRGAPDMKAADLRDLSPAPLPADCVTRQTRKRLPTKHASNRLLTKTSFGGVASL